MSENRPQSHRSYERKPKKKDFNSYKRSAIRNFSSYISMFIIVPVFAAIALFLLVFPRSDVSQIEKRKLAEFPVFTLQNYFSGAFTNGVTKFYDDTVPFRDDFKTAGYGIQETFGIKTGDTATATGKLQKVKPASPSTDSSKTETSEASKSQTDKTEESTVQTSTEEKSNKDYTKEDADFTVENGIIVVNQDGHYRALEMFGGGTGDSYVAALNKIRGELDKSIKIYSMTVPLASEFYTPANYTDYTANQKEYFDMMSKRFDSGITYVDADSVLAKHTEENIYLRTDHHWSSLGAYYAAETFAKSAGVPFKDISTFKKETIPNFVGTMYAFTGDINIKNDPEDFDYYVPDNNDKCTTYYYDTSFNYLDSGNFFNQVGDPESNAYLTFMGGDEQIVKVKTNVKNNRRLVIIKDSYGNAEPQFYMNSFEEIYVVDMRYFNLNLVDFINSVKATDVLFTMVTYSAFGDNAENLDPIITQNKGQTITDGALNEENN